MTDSSLWSLRGERRKEEGFEFYLLRSLFLLKLLRDDDATMMRRRCSSSFYVVLSAPIKWRKISPCGGGFCLEKALLSSGAIDITKKKKQTRWY